MHMQLWWPQDIDSLFQVQRESYLLSFPEKECREGEKKYKGNITSVQNRKEKITKYKPFAYSATLTA